MADLIEQDIPTLGKVTLWPLGYGMMGEAYEHSLQAKENERPNVFTNLVLSYMFVEPSQTPEDIANLSDDAITVLIDTAVDKSGIRKHFDKVPANFSPQEKLYKAYLESFEELSRMIQTMTQVWRESHNNFMAFLAESISTYSEQINKALSQIVPAYTLENIGRSLGKMVALNIRQTAFDIPLAKFGSGDLISSTVQRMQELVHSLKIQPLHEIVEQIMQIDLTEPFLSDALYISGLNSPLIHTPTYTFPEVEPPTTIEEIETQAEEAERRRLLDAYDILIRLEQSLRMLIETKLKHAHGARWWKRGVPYGVRKSCEERKQDKEASSNVSYHPICYAYVDDYRAIIMEGQNWKTLFAPIFGNKIELDACFIWVGKVRPSIAHVRSISDDEYEMFVAGAHWLQSALTRSVKATNGTTYAAPI